VALEVRPDPNDQLPALEAQDWAEHKHELLSQYLEISRGARRGFVAGSGGATYIDLFAGPGRLFLKDSGNFIDGSPLIAIKQAAHSRTQFNEVHLGDTDPSFCDALQVRMKALGIQPSTYPYAADESAKRIAKKLNRYGLHFVFLDPFGLEHLPFSIIETFGELSRVDLLVHVSAMDLNRNLPQYMDQTDCSLDTFAPGWRKVVEGMKPGAVARGKIIEHWCGRARELGFKDALAKPLIRGKGRQPLYYLMLLAKSDLARKFWNAINRDNQGSMDFGS
jgi:three-Cys-motif partner protein